MNSVDIIVCLDACFTQKRCKSAGKRWMPPFEHPETVFVSPEEVCEMEELVEQIRPSKQSRANQAEMVADFQTGIQVPNEVLQECNKSFVAADSNRIKASTKYFADTGLMGMLCRHDRVLFLANMTSAGEKQHYALCLLENLFRHIPKKMRVGVLYDIACQLHQSCQKYHFLAEFLDRIVFGVSVFHAYGHQWPCQLIYHPRKCTGFGLTDGESCERFWGSIKLLIPNLRVSGYHNRIYTLDTQIKHLDNKSQISLGSWLSKKWIKMIDRKSGAEDILLGLANNGITLEFLKEEWKKQVAEQTKPLKRQSPQLANKEIYDILALLENIDRYKGQIELYQNMLESGDYEEDLTSIEVQSLILDLEKQQTNARKSVANKKKNLSVDGRLNLQRLVDNEFLKKRMNALAVKQRIRDRLRNRKFELENLERSYRKTSNQLKLDKNANQQIKRKEPGIQVLVRKYNLLCVDLEKLIKQKKAPRGALVPNLIMLEGLFDLDVDDDIWQDIGLTDESDGISDIPCWLGDDNVREGIKVMLEYHRCLEEERRLKYERIAMQEWMLEEWKVVSVGLECCEKDEDVSYALRKHSESLLRLCVKWEPVVRIIPCELGQSWGPTLEEIAQYKAFENSAQFLQNVEDENELDSNIDDDIDADDAAFLDDMEMFTLSQQLHYM